MPRLTNAKIVELAMAYKAAKARTRPTPAQAAAAEEADGIRDELLAQLRLRRVDKLELDGVIVTRKAKTTRIYSLTGLRKVLPRSLFLQVAPPTVDVAGLDAAVKAGQVDGDAVEKCLERTDEGKPYIDVRLTKPTG